jgi:isoquinoline 1-oxidoreductase subunit alpha
MITLHVNGKPHDLNTDPDTPLLWVLRDELGLTGTKYACGISKCGSCMVHVDGKAVTSCTTSISSVAGKEITTIEGLSTNEDELHPVQRAWLDENVPECGYCQSGQIMAASALLASKSDPTDEDIDKAMSGVLCRCGTYQRIRKAIKRASKNGNESGGGK